MHEAWSRCCQWHIPCHLKPPAISPQPPSPITPAQGASRQPQSPTNQSTSRHVQPQPQQQQQQQQQLPNSMHADVAAGQVASPQVVHLNVGTCAVLPNLALEGDSSWQPDRGLWELDFGAFYHYVCIISALPSVRTCTGVHSS